MTNTKQEGFLTKLKYPNRERVNAHIEYWLDDLNFDGILSKHHIVIDNIHNIYIVTEDTDSFRQTELSFKLHFRPTYKYGHPIVGTDAYADTPNDEHPFAHVRQYIILENN